MKIKERSHEGFYQFQEKMSCAKRSRFVYVITGLWGNDDRCEVLLANKQDTKTCIFTKDRFLIVNGKKTSRWYH